jgi:sec-independent protein translocase protein TatA
MFEGLLQPMHLMIIMVIALVVLGPGKLGDLGGQLGRGMREFKQQVNDGEHLALGSGGRFCTQCGAPNDASARFCPRCGTKAAGTA